MCSALFLSYCSSYFSTHTYAQALTLPEALLLLSFTQAFDLTSYESMRPPSLTMSTRINIAVYHIYAHKSAGRAADLMLKL